MSFNRALSSVLARESIKHFQTVDHFAVVPKDWKKKASTASIYFWMRTSTSLSTVRGKVPRKLLVRPFFVTVARSCHRCELVSISLKVGGDNRYVGGIKRKTGDRWSSACNNKCRLHRTVSTRGTVVHSSQGLYSNRTIVFGSCTHDERNRF